MRKILITGIGGFVGSALAESLFEQLEDVSICGIDNLMRPGSEVNRARLKRMGVEFFHGDIRCASDFEALPKVDWVIDAAANPSVLAGVNGRGSTRQLFEHNLASLVNILEYCKTNSAGLLLLSSSRVYSIEALAALPLKIENSAFILDTTQPLPAGASACGIGVNFSTEPPISLYGSTKLASEAVALEYGFTFDFPVWINRCGVMAGPGQFGTPDHGIFAYWVNAHLRKRLLRYIGFNGQGPQVRDVLHPRDVAALLAKQMQTTRKAGRRIYNAGGGPANSMSLAQLNAWCNDQFGEHTPQPDTRARPFDIPWMIMDNELIAQELGWRPKTSISSILMEIASHAREHPHWLEVSGL
jgi:CDP-paratose 2-epimerase